MARYVLRAEGVNFTATLYDTHDISTIRGSGLALLELGVAVRAALGERPEIADVEEIYSGASQTAWNFTAPPDGAEVIRQMVAASLLRPGSNGEPFDHLSIVLDVVEGEGAEALEQAEAGNRARQFRQWTVPLPEFTSGAAGYDENDRYRPVPPGKLSATSVEARHRFGRQMRGGFYRRVVGRAADGVQFADSFEEIVEGSPPDLPLSVRSGLAVIYADGNGFGAVRKKMGAKEFGSGLAELRTALLKRLLDWLRDGAKSSRHNAYMNGERLRFETLLWGGDELMFVLPAWLGFGFLEEFFDATRDWTLGDSRLTHTAALVVCHHKMPIRLSRGIAHDVVEGLKEAFHETSRGLGNAVGFEIFESLTPPLDGLDSYRSGLYGDMTEPLIRSLALPGDGIAPLRQRWRPEAPVPRSQLHRMLQAARRVGPSEGGPIGAKASEAARSVLADYARRVKPVAEAELRLPGLPGEPVRPLALGLTMIEQLWDYLDPLGTADLERGA